MFPSSSRRSLAIVRLFNSHCHLTVFGKDECSGDGSRHEPIRRRIERGERGRANDVVGAGIEVGVLIRIFEKRNVERSARTRLTLIPDRRRDGVGKREGLPVNLDGRYVDVDDRQIGESSTRASEKCEA